MDWFLYDNGLHLEGVKHKMFLFRCIGKLTIMTNFVFVKSVIAFLKCLHANMAWGFSKVFAIVVQPDIETSFGYS